MSDGRIPEHLAIIPEERSNSGRRTRSRSSERRTEIENAPSMPDKSFKQFCGQVGRLLGRITAECAEGTEEYDRVVTWFCQWLCQLGVIFRFVKRPADEYVQSPHYTAFCRRNSDGARSAFFLYEDVGEEFVRLSRLPKNRRTYEANGMSFTVNEALRWAEGIQCFLNSSTEADTFARFIAEVSK